MVGKRDDLKSTTRGESYMEADPSGRTVGLRPLVDWDYGFESCRWHGYLSLATVARCQVEVSATS
jgi:hypothetical protein